MFEPLPEERLDETSSSDWPRPLCSVGLPDFANVATLDMVSASESCMRPERSHFRARSLSLYVGNLFDRGRSRNRIQAKIMLGSSYMARPTWLYLPGAILVLKDK